MADKKEHYSDTITAQIRGLGTVEIALGPLSPKKRAEAREYVKKLQDYKRGGERAFEELDPPDNVSVAVRKDSAPEESKLLSTFKVDGLGTVELSGTSGADTAALREYIKKVQSGGKDAFDKLDPPAGVSAVLSGQERGPSQEPGVYSVQNLDPKTGEPTSEWRDSPIVTIKDGKAYYGGKELKAREDVKFGKPNEDVKFGKSNEGVKFGKPNEDVKFGKPNEGVKFGKPNEGLRVSPDVAGESPLEHINRVVTVDNLRKGVSKLLAPEPFKRQEPQAADVQVRSMTQQEVEEQKSAERADGVDTNAESPLSNIARNASEFGQALYDVTAAPARAVNAAIDGNPSNTPVDPATGAPLADPLDVPATVPNATQGAQALPLAPLPGQSGSASLKASVSGGGSAPGIKDPSQAMFDKAMSEERTAAILRAQAEAEMHKKASTAQEEAMAKSLEFESRKAEAMNQMTEEMHRHETGLQDLQRQVLEAGQQQVDPGRYWANKDSGQKAAAVIAGALFGFTGQGMQWMQRLDGLVEQDIRAQQADIANRRSSLKEATGIQENLIALAETRGMRGMAAVDAARATMWANTKQQIDLYGMQTQGSDPMLAAKVMEASAAAGQKQALFTQKSVEGARKYAIDAGQLALQKKSLEMKMAEAGYGRGGQEFKPSQQKRIAELLSVGKQIGQMRQDYKEQASSWISPISANMGLGMQATDASKWDNSSRQFHAQTLGTTIEGGKLTDADFADKYLKSFVPAAKDTSGAVDNKVKNFVNYAVTKYQAELQSLKAANVDTSDLPTAEEYRAQVTKDAMGGSFGTVRK